MGKDKSGKFHPGKGKPSGINKEEGLGIHATPPEHMKQYNELTGKYTEGEDVLSPNVLLRHPNRKTSKGEDFSKAKENKAGSNTTVNHTPDENHTPSIAEEIPGILTKDSFKELAAYQSPLCISIFLGTHTAGEEVNEHYDAVSFKNTLQKAESILKERNYRANEIERMLKPGYELLKNDDFWLKLSPGLAVFIADDYFKYIKMPQSATEYVTVEDTFYVTPL